MRIVAMAAATSRVGWVSGRSWPGRETTSTPSGSRTRREEVARRGLQGGDGAESPGLDGVDHRVGHQEAEFGPHAGIEHDRAAHRAEGVARDEACVHVVLPRGAYDQRP